MKRIKDIAFSLFCLLLILCNFSVCYADVIVFPPQYFLADVEMDIYLEKGNKVYTYSSYIKEKAEKHNTTVEEYKYYLRHFWVDNENECRNFINELYKNYYNNETGHWKELPEDVFTLEDGLKGCPVTFEDYQVAIKEGVVRSYYELALFVLFVIFWIIILVMVINRYKQINNKCFTIENNDKEKEDVL